MKHLFTLLLSLIGIASFGQRTVHGYCTHYESQDSSAIMNRYFSTETFDSTGERIYEKLFPLGNPDAEYRINYYIGKTKNRIRESIIGKDTARYSSIYDTLHCLSYIIAGSDTSFKYRLRFENGQITESSCLVGCDYKQLIGYNEHGDEDTVLTIWDKGDTSYCIYDYDEQHRMILKKDYLNKPSDSLFSYLESKYDDHLLTQTDTYGSTTRIDDKQVVITFFNDKRIPIKKEIIEIHPIKSERWIIEYRQE